MRRPLVTLLTLIAVAATAAGCGSSSSGSAASAKPATLVLDFTPNPVHVGIYTAIAHHFDTAAGVKLHVIAPSASTDSIHLLETGRVDFAILDIHDLAIARERGEDIVGILPIVERPLASVIAEPSVTSPRELIGKTVGVSGAPSDTAVLDSIVAGAGGRPKQLKTITIGFNAVADLLAGRVAAATAFWNDEGQAIQSRRPGFHIFRVDEYGAPSYPELVLCATRATLTREPTLAQHVVHALVKGYEFTLSEPSRAADDLERLVPGLDPKLVAAQLAGLLPAFRGPGGQVGVLDPARLRAWARWEVRFGIVPRAPDVTRAFDPSLTG